MGYYAGDYYRGDWKSFLGTVGKNIVGSLAESLTSSAGAMGAGALQSALAGPSSGLTLSGALSQNPLARALSGGGGGGAAAPAATAYGGRRRYRRMNPLNARALRRSMRRVHAFAKFARHTMTFTQHHRMKRTRRKR